MSFLQKEIKCHNLNSSNSVFSDFGRRMSSFIFGSQPVSNKDAVSVNSTVVHYSCGRVQLYNNDSILKAVHVYFQC